MLKLTLFQSSPILIKNADIIIKSNGTKKSVEISGHAALFETVSLWNTAKLNTETIQRLMVVELVTDNLTEMAKIETPEPFFFDNGSWSVDLTKSNKKIKKDMFHNNYKPDERFCWVRKVHYKKVSDLPEPLKARFLESVFKNKSFAEKDLLGFV